MSNNYIILLGVTLLLGGCSLIDTTQIADTKKHIIRGLDGKLSQKLQEVSYSEDSQTEEMVEDLSSYVISNNDDVEEVSNVYPLKTGRKVFNRDLMVVKKYFDKKKVKLSIEEMPLNKFLHLVFSKVLKVDYVLDKTVQKSQEPVSINITEKISKEKLFSIVSNVLEEFRIVIEIEGDVFYIKKSSKGVSSSVHKVYFGTSVPKGLNDNDVIYMMRPFYYNKQISKHNIFIKNYFLSKKSDLRIDEFESIIQIKDKVKNIRKALEFYSFIDQPSMRNKQMKLIRMKHMNVVKFIDQLKPILDNYGILIATSPKSAGVQLVPIEQINSFLLLSSKEEWIKTILFWKSKLDIMEKSTSEDLEFFVYKPLNRKAEELVTVLQSFPHFYEGNAITSKAEASVENTATTESETTNTEGSSSITSGISSENSLNNRGNKTTVVLDKERNNIIIYATQKRYIAIQKMLKSLDTLPKQVLIEVTIADISLTKSLKFGFEWFLENNGYNIKGLDGKGDSGATGLLLNMFSVSEGLSSVFSAAETKDYVNILSNPKLLVLNNHSASINVGNRVPILSSQAASADAGAAGGIIQTINYQETGISLSVKPTINSDGYLSLNITQNVSTAKQNTISKISSPVIFNRALQTDVVLKSGETVVLGGLISEGKTKNEGGIPILGKIPVIGKLFSNSGDSVEKNELVILIKPTILRNNSDATVVTEALLELMNFN